jgi:RNA polymerase sigma factor (sigma-70 family)
VEALAPRPSTAPIHTFEPSYLEPGHGIALEAGRDADLYTWTGLESLRSDVRAAVARRCRSRRVEIEDVVQEALLRAARYRHKLNDPERLRAWVIRIGLNVLRDQMRRDLRIPRVEKGDDVFDLLEGREEIPGDPPEDDALVAEGAIFERCTVMRHLDRAFEELPRGDRRVLTAYYERDEGSRRASCVREAGAELFKMRVHRARGRLERALRKRLCLNPRVRSRASRVDDSAQQIVRSATCAPARRTELQSGQAAGIPT